MIGFKFIFNCSYESMFVLSYTKSQFLFSHLFPSEDFRLGALARGSNNRAHLFAANLSRQLYECLLPIRYPPDKKICVSSIIYLSEYYRKILNLFIVVPACPNER